MGRHTELSETRSATCDGIPISVSRNPNHWNHKRPPSHRQGRRDPNPPTSPSDSPLHNPQQWIGSHRISPPVPNSSPDRIPTLLYRLSAPPPSHITNRHFKHNGRPVKEADTHKRLLDRISEGVVADTPMERENAQDVDMLDGTTRFHEVSTPNATLQPPFFTVPSPALAQTSPISTESEIAVANLLRVASNAEEDTSNDRRSARSDLVETEGLHSNHAADGIRTASSLMSMSSDAGALSITSNGGSTRPQATTLVDNVRESLFPVLLRNAKLRDRDNLSNSLPYKVADAAHGLLTDEICSEFIRSGQSVMMQINDLKQRHETPEPNTTANGKRPNVDSDLETRKRTRFSQRNDIDVTPLDDSIIRRSSSKTPPKAPRAMIDRNRSVVEKTSHLPGTRHENRVERSTSGPPTPGSLHRFDTSGSPSDPVISGRNPKSLPVSSSTRQGRQQQEISNEKASTQNSRETDGAGGGHYSLATTDSFDHRATNGSQSQQSTSTSQPPLLGNGNVSAKCPVPGFWFTQVGAAHADVVELDFEVDNEIVLAASPPYKDPTISLKLVCLSRAQAEPICATLGLGCHGMALHPLQRIDHQWPPQGSLIIELNKNHPVSQTWMPLHMHPKSPPLDVTPYVHLGLNRFRFIQLGDLSEWMFFLHASTPNARPNSQGVDTVTWNKFLQNWRAELWGTLTKGPNSLKFSSTPTK